jgi:hypothetical protein|nr:MAG TPA: hypothetical protein [Caudoviricetes sp.]
MIKIENVEVMGWEAAIRGMRNPKNSWDRSDSGYSYISDVHAIIGGELIHQNPAEHAFCIGKNDLDLMKRLRNAGTDHRKFMRMITVYLDITAPLYWWKEFDTYKVGTVANSCSTMHKIADKEFTLEDFSHEHLCNDELALLEEIIARLNMNRIVFIAKNDKQVDRYTVMSDECYAKYKKTLWWQLIQLLPSSYNQRRTVMLNYEVLANIYKSRRNHKLDEWHTFCDWIETLPYSQLITGIENKED